MNVYKIELLLSWLFECQIVNMLQLKVFYNVPFPEVERCELYSYG